RVQCPRRLSEPDDFSTDVRRAGRLHGQRGRPHPRLVVSGVLYRSSSMTITASRVLAKAQAIRAEGPRGGNFLALGVVAGATVTVALRVLGGRADGTLWIGFVVALGCAVAARPLAGYYVLLSTVILADDWMLHFSPWTHRVLGYYVFANWWKLLS